MIPKKYLNCGKDLFLHRMVVYSFGDCKNREFSNYGWRNVIDHLDMDHDHNYKSNLQLVSQGINLFRAYYKTSMQSAETKSNQNSFYFISAALKETNNTCESRFKNYYNSLDAIDRMILTKEIELDLKGEY